MAISGINTTMRQLNIQATREGQNVVHQTMQEVKSDFFSGSPIDSTTKIGTGEISRSNNEINEVGAQDLAQIMEQDDQYMETSNFGNQPAISPSGILNDFAPK